MRTSLWRLAACVVCFTLLAFHKTSAATAWNGIPTYNLQIKHPVNGTSWLTLVVFCIKANAQLQRTRENKQLLFATAQLKRKRGVRSEEESATTHRPHLTPPMGAPSNGCSQVCVECVCVVHRFGGQGQGSFLVGTAPLVCPCFIHRAGGSPLSLLHSDSHSLSCYFSLLYFQFQYVRFVLVHWRLNVQITKVKWEKISFFFI